MSLKALLKKTPKTKKTQKTNPKQTTRKPTKQKTSIGEVRFGKVLNPGLQAGVWEHFGVMRVAAPCHRALQWWGQGVTVLSRWCRVPLGTGSREELPHTLAGTAGVPKVPQLLPLPGTRRSSRALGLPKYAPGTPRAQQASSSVVANTQRVRWPPGSIRVGRHHAMARTEPGAARGCVQQPSYCVWVPARTLPLGAFRKRDRSSNAA